MGWVWVEGQQLGKKGGGTPISVRKGRENVEYRKFWSLDSKESSEGAAAT